MIDEITVAPPPDRFKAKIIGGIILAVIFPLVAGIVLARFHINYIDRVFYSRFIYWGDVLLLLFYAFKIEHQPLLIWKERAPDVMFLIGSVVLLYLLGIAAGFIANIPHLLGWPENNQMLKKVTAVMKNHSLLLVFTALTAGVTEELIFRGYVLTRLSLLFKNWYVPVIISSVLFSLLHYGYWSLRELIFTFLIGVIYSVYYQKYRNIKALIIVHFLVDLVAMTIAQHIMK
jgi:membrane protease YdiL (CAAX protease family)